MADGYLNFDTKINTSGFNKGLKSVGSVAAGALAGITGVLGGAAAYAIKVGSEFEAGMSEVGAISQASSAELEQLSEKAKEMGAKTKFSATEAADGLKYMAMAGWKTSDMLDGIEGIMNLAAASGEDLATTSDIVTDALTAFGLTAKDSGHFADILAAASSNANTKAMDDWRLRSRKHRHDYHQVHQPICQKHFGLPKIYKAAQGYEHPSFIRERVH